MQFFVDSFLVSLPNDFSYRRYGFGWCAFAVQLANGNDRVRAIYRNNTSKSKTKALFESKNAAHLVTKIDWVVADLNDISSLENAFLGVKYVYHCAALISFDPADEQQLRKINIEGTANIVNFCIDYKVQKLCFVSSIAALGHLAPHESFLSETTEWNPEKANSDYAISKYGAEMEVWRGQQEGLKVVIVNPGIIFGAGFFGQISGTFFSKIHSKTAFYSNGISGFISATDVATILIKLMTSSISGQRFIAISENRSFKSIFDAIAVVLNAKKPFILATPFLVNLYWRFDWLKSFLLRTKRTFSRYNAQSSCSTDLISNQKIIDAIDFSFQSVDDCIAEVGKNFNESKIRS